MLAINRTVKDALVENIRDEIITGQLRPDQKLRQEELAAHFDVSTMPVREALRDLEAEGLVTITPRRGAVVTRLSVEDLQDIYDIRATLEEMATRLAVVRMEEAALADLAQCLKEIDRHLGDALILVKLNHRFHSTLYAASDRRHLCDLVGMLRRRTQHYVYAYIRELGGMPQAQTEHRAILEACQRGDADQAAEIMRQHVAKVGRAMMEYVQMNDRRNRAR
jgi:DNA-binding GntR family transcriptional regulator